MDDEAYCDFDFSEPVPRKNNCEKYKVRINRFVCLWAISNHTFKEWDRIGGPDTNNLNCKAHSRLNWNENKKGVAGFKQSWKELKEHLTIMKSILRLPNLAKIGQHLF